MLDERGIAYRYAFNLENGTTFKATLVATDYRNWNVIVFAQTPDAEPRITRIADDFRQAIEYARRTAEFLGKSSRRGNIVCLDSLSSTRFSVMENRPNKCTRKRFTTASGLVFLVIVYTEKEDLGPVSVRYEIHNLYQNTDRSSLLCSNRSLGGEYFTLKEAQQQILSKWSESYIQSCEDDDLQREEGK